jgi:superfamily II RNA helicase
MVVICSQPYSSESYTKYQEYFEWFPYSLSDFQKYSIQSIVEGQHSLVTAHTGSGKSLPAEFALQYFHKKGKKTIYTSPIKALSNQKYYEFTQKYPEISFGLITGDIKLNPTADVLIMTAEILLNALFVTKTPSDASFAERPPNTFGVQGYGISDHRPEESTQNLQFQIDIKNELACVVMDEIHYINDRDRGSVWEKTILMLPKHIQMIMLSATIDSPEKFAKWCERDDTTKQVWLSSTSHRIVPLTHYGFLITNEGFFKKTKDKSLHQQVRDGTQQLLTLKTADGKYQEDAYLKLIRTKKLIEDYNVAPKRSHVLNQLCVFLKERDMFPAIAFVFSRKNVELYAKEITANLLEDDSKIPYIVARECDQIIRKLPNYQEYANLPEYHQLVKLLEKGVGIHHSGMIPILREIVELMISKKYIKLLLATESFAIGLNCPIRTAIFTSLTKFDGNDDRFLLPHEYNQAASRCGRRGIDTVGHVIHCNNLFSMPSQYEYKNMLCGSPQSLSSKMRISMPFVLNLMKTYGNELDALAFINQSMIRHELDKNQQSITKRVQELEQSVNKNRSSMSFLRTSLEVCQEYLSLVKILNTLTNKKRKDAERRIQQLVCDHKFIKEDAIQVETCMKMEMELIKEREEFKYGETYLSTKIENICFLLCKHEFLCTKDELENYVLTRKGKMACSLAEINPIVMAEILEMSNYMRDLSAVQIVKLLSCFTDVKVSQDVRLSIPATKDTAVRQIVEEYQKIINKYHEYIQEQNITISNNGSDSDLELMYDLMDMMEEWCLCEDEAQCKEFIQSKLTEKSISIGDFTKAILKISTMVKELMNICEQNEDMLKLLSKLGKIDVMILKYITTAQSLYI